MTLIGAVHGKDLFDVVWLGGWNTKESSEWMRYFTLGQRVFKIAETNKDGNPLKDLFPVPPYSADARKHGVDPPNDWLPLVPQSTSPSRSR